MSLVLIEEAVVTDLKYTLEEIKKELITIKRKSTEEDEYVSYKIAALRLSCGEQTIRNFEKEKLIKRYGRGSFIRFSMTEIKKAMGITE